MSWRKAGKPKKYVFEASFFNRGSRYMREIQENSGTGQALHVMYLLRTSRQRLGWLEHYWTNIPISQAVQNRAFLVRQCIGEILRGRCRHRILELAAGLAEPVLWGVADHPKACEAILLTDLAQAPLEQAQSIARHELQLRCEVECKRLNLLNLEKVKQTIRQFQPTIVEVIGYIDYLEDERAVRFLRAIFEEMKVGSTLITGNVLPISRAQRLFIEQAYRWPSMHYRDIGALQRLLVAAGFTNPEIRLEPNRIFAIAIARR